jgi:phi13 family phage major tail protein
MTATPNKIKYGLRNVYYAVATEGSGGALTYATPVAMPGAVSMSIAAQGATNPFYADDVIYYSSTENNGYQGTLELALIPDSFKTDVLGEVLDNNGVYFEKSGTPTVEFALLFEFQGDQNATRHAFYRCTASRADVNGATKTDSITPQTETLNITAMPRIDTKVVKGSCPYSSAKYATWNTTVYDTPTVS